MTRFSRSLKATIAKRICVVKGFTLPRIYPKFASLLRGKCAMTVINTLEDNGFLTAEQVGARFPVPVSADTVRRWTREEGLPVVILGHQRLYKWSTVMAWLHDREEASSRKSA